MTRCKEQSLSRIPRLKCSKDNVKSCQKCGMLSFSLCWPVACVFQVLALQWQNFWSEQYQWPLSEEVIEMRCNHIRLIQGYIGNLLAIRHDNKVNIVDNRQLRKTVYLLLSCVIWGGSPNFPMYVDFIPIWHRQPGKSPANWSPSWYMEHIQIIPA